MSDVQTLYQLIARHAQERPNKVALRGELSNGRFTRAVTWKEYLAAVREIARALMHLGVQKGDSVSLIAANQIEWVLVQHGIAATGAIPCPIYTTNLPEQVAYIFDHSESKLIFLDSKEQLEKLEAMKEEGKLEHLEHAITFADLGESPLPTMTLDALRALAPETSEAELDARLATIEPDDFTLRIYTSGTTGLPKGAQVSHRGIWTVAHGSVTMYEKSFSDDARAVSYLPLCHVAEQIFTNFTPLQVGSEVAFCPALPELKDHLVAQKPTYMLGVPRVWEKFEAALQSRFAEASGLRARLIAWARATEAAGAAEDRRTGTQRIGFARSMARRLVIDKILGNLGLDELELAFSGAAPISPSSLEFFASIGITIHEGFGMTETSGVATGQPAGRAKFGTVGQPIPGVEVKIGDDGEILLRGHNMVREYHKLDEKTKELWTDDGWMHTGDLGSLDDEGYLKITGRKKDLLITAGGKNVGPAEIEAHLLAIPGIGQAVAVGDRKPYLCALLTLDPESLGVLLEAAGADAGLDAEAAAKDAAVQAYVRKQIDELCNAHVARYQQIKYFELLPQPFTVETGELTPTMKIKRNVVTEKFGAQIEGMYADKQNPKKAAAAPAE
jgi:long-chain acyl-CoA synthetase